MKQFVIISLLALMILVSGCQYFGTTNDTNDLTGKIVLEDDDFVFIEDNQAADDSDDAAMDSETEDVDDVDDADSAQVETGVEIEEIDEEDVAYTITVTEGELVTMDFEAVDPDGDALDYTFTEPLNAQGRWQTQLGDEGKYLATVTVSDGKLSTSEDVLLIVERANRAPVVECPETITIEEGETLNIKCNIYDEEGDNILTSYEGWSTSSEKETGYDDAGEYTVLVRASDGNNENTFAINVVVDNVNRAPEIDGIDDITVMETTDVKVDPRVEDPDGDDVSVTFSKPLNNNGEWQTDDGDAGVYKVTATASDGSATATAEFTITVTQINTAPVLRPIADIEVDEGDTIIIPVNAYDPEGDELIIGYSGFMDSREYETDYDEAGVYDQTVTVSDGVLESSQSFTITINDKNRAPTFVFPGG